VLPLIAMRNALFTPGTFGPIHVARAGSMAAALAALARRPPTLALFSQRAEETENVDAEALHPVGCEAIVYAQIADGERAWVVLEGVRWLGLDALGSAADGYQVAHVRAMPVDRGDPAEVAALAGALLTCARPLASALPGGPRLVAMLDALEAEPLADLVIGNLPVSVAEKARYASEPRLAERLRIATRLTQALAASGAAPR
jgi:Lon protease-like protein